MTVAHYKILNVYFDFIKCNKIFKTNTDLNKLRIIAYKIKISKKISETLYSL